MASQEAPAADQVIVRPAYQKRSREKRDRLIAAGLEIFARDGYDGARIADIADAAGLSVGLFYQRFKDKRSFFIALETEFVQRGCRNWDRFFDSADPAWSAARLIDDLVPSLHRVVRRNIGFFRGLITLGQQDENIVAPGRKLDRYGAAKLNAHLVQHQLIDPQRLPASAVYIALTAIMRSLIMAELLAHNNRMVSRKRMVREHARMLTAYLTQDSP